MPKSEELTKEARVKKEFNRLRRLLKEIPDEQLKMVTGLVHRVSFMAVLLEDMESDINEYGVTEFFSQTKDIEYERQRPIAGLYNTTVKNYTTACKQLADLLPDTPKSGAGDSDPLMEFVKAGKRK